VIEQGIDTDTIEGRAMFGMLSVLAELQRELIVANTMDGLASARTRGRVGGRRPRLSEGQAALAQELYDARVKTVQQIALGGVGDALPYGDYFAGALDAGDERRRQRRRAGPLVDVHVVDACRAHTDQDLSGPGGRPLAVGRLEDSGVPGPGHCYCAHRPSPIWLSRLSRGAGGLSAWSG
jgi:hypothetical protein